MMLHKLDMSKKGPCVLPSRTCRFQQHTVFAVSAVATRASQSLSKLYHLQGPHLQQYVCLLMLLSLMAPQHSTSSPALESTCVLCAVLPSCQCPLHPPTTSVVTYGNLPSCRTVPLCLTRGHRVLHCTPAVLLPCSRSVCADGYAGCTAAGL